MLRIQTNLTADLEDLVARTIGACVAVHRELGPGLLETIYQRALAIELADKEIPFSSEKAIPIHYRGKLVCHQRLDILVDDRLVVEAKAVERLMPLHVAQVINYLRVTGARVGLLVNCNVPLLKHGIRRVVL
jgi:GxxExxY protein